MQAETAPISISVFGDLNVDKKVASNLLNYIDNKLFSVQKVYLQKVYSFKYAPTETAMSLCIYMSNLFCPLSPRKHIIYTPSMMSQHNKKTYR